MERRWQSEFVGIVSEATGYLCITSPISGSDYAGNVLFSVLNA